MKNNICFSLLITMGISFYSCNSDSKENKSITKEVIFKKEGELTLYQKDSISRPITTLDIEIADNDYEIQTGLMYRKSMQKNQGMLFIFPEEAPRSFYMKNTKISLDIIFIDKENQIVSIQKNAKPLDLTSLASEGPAQYVLEVNAGLSELWNLKKGDPISFIKM